LNSPETLTADVTALPVSEAPGAKAALPAWLAVASLGVGAFATVTTEFLPIGLLPSIAATLGVSEGTAGLMVTMPGVVAAVAGPALIVASGRLDRRAVLIALSALLVGSNLLAALAPNFATMLVARLMLGLCVGGFWTFAPGAATFLVPPAEHARAMSYVLTGISVATVAGVPAGSLLSNLMGWRASFAAAALVGAVVLAFQLRLLPAMPPARATGLRDLLTPLVRGGARLGLLVTLFLVAGHFAAYTYLTPLLLQVFRQPPAVVTTLLLVYGVAGFVGTFFGGRLAARGARGITFITAALIALTLLLSALFGGGLVGGVLVVALWGVAFGFLPVAMTTWMLEALPDAPEAGQALLVTAFQVAIASGALVGGLVVDGVGVAGAMWLGGGLAALASGIVAVGASPRRATA